jgi:hypothetical protein
MLTTHTLMQSGHTVKNKHQVQCNSAQSSAGVRMFLGHPDPEVRIRIRLRILPFSHKCVERTQKMSVKLHFSTKFLAKNTFFKAEDDVPVGKL